jgi:flagellar biosynthesis/type III secretory pathway chaperone
MSEPLDLARSLLALLDEEFEALKRRDLERFESFQPVKIQLLNQLTARVAEQPGREAMSSETQDLLRQARDAHRRNETLIQHQLAAIRGALQALTASAALQSVEVYDKLGHVQTRRSGRGYGEV